MGWVDLVEESTKLSERFDALAAEHPEKAMKIMVDILGKLVWALEDPELPSDMKEKVIDVALLYLQGMTAGLVFTRATLEMPNDHRG